MITKILLIGMLALAIALCVIHMMPKKIKKKLVAFRFAAMGIFVAIQIIFSVIHFVDIFVYPKSVQELKSEIDDNTNQIYELQKEIEETEKLNESKPAQEYESTKTQQEMIRELEDKNLTLKFKLTDRQALDDLFMLEDN